MALTHTEKEHSFFFFFFFFCPWGPIHLAPVHHSEFILYHLPYHLPVLRSCFRTDAEAETPILWPPDAENWLIRKDPDAGKHWRQEEKGTTEDEMVEWHHWLNGHEFEQTPGVGNGQGGLACCSPWGCKELDTSEWLNWTEDHASLPDLEQD